MHRSDYSGSSYSMLGSRFVRLHVHDNAAAVTDGVVIGDPLRSATPDHVSAASVVAIISSPWRPRVTQRWPDGWRGRFRHAVVTRYQLQRCRVPSTQSVDIEPRNRIEIKQV